MRADCKIEWWFFRAKLAKISRKRHDYNFVISLERKSEKSCWPVSVIDQPDFLTKKCIKKLIKIKYLCLLLKKCLCLLRTDFGPVHYTYVCKVNHKFRHWSLEKFPLSKQVHPYLDR